MATPRLLLFIALSGAVHAVLLGAVTDRVRVPSEATDALRVTLLAPGRAASSHDQALTRRDRQKTSAAPNGNETFPPAHMNPEVDPVAAGQRDSNSPRSSADVRGRKVQALLYRALRTAFDYPLLAQRQGWQGEVRIALTVRASGQLSDVRIVGTSGYAILDEAAIRSVRQIREVPDAVALLNGESLELVLPVRYQLLAS
jgi:TonB family protein